MLTPQQWMLVIGAAFAFVAVVGLGMTLVQGNGGFAWVLIGFAAASSVLAFVMAAGARRAQRESESQPGSQSGSVDPSPERPGPGS